MQLSSFRISGFRAFNELTFRGFSNVNLLVGRNNVGKTTVLEALRLYLSQDWLRIADLLTSRDEFSLRKRRRRAESSFDSAPLAFKSLFYGRPALEGHPSFSVGPLDSAPLEISFAWVRRVEDEATASVRYVPGVGADPDVDPDLLPGFIIDFQGRTLVPLDRIERVVRRRQPRPTEQSIVYLPSSGMSADDLGRTWDSVALTEDEDVVIATLKAIVPTLDKLVLVQSPSRSSERLLMAKLSEFSEPVPFRSLGDGALHLLEVVLGLANARGGVLLTDEIENGLHFSNSGEILGDCLETSKSVECSSIFHDAQLGLRPWPPGGQQFERLR